MVKITMAHLDLPLCEKQSDLTGYVSRILKQTTKLSSVVKREVRLLLALLFSSALIICYGCV